MTLMEPVLAALLILGSVLILRAVWKSDTTTAATTAAVPRPEPAPDYRKAA